MKKIHPFPSDQVQTRFKSCILGLKFVASLLFKVGRCWRWILKLFKVGTLNAVDGY